jgi:hypothetical protein
MPREHDPLDESANRCRILRYVGALAVVALGASFFLFRPDPLRYEIHSIGSGAAVARLDKITGEIVIVRIDGSELSRYPSFERKP